MKMKCIFLFPIFLVVLTNIGFSEERKIYSVGAEVKSPKPIRNPMPPYTAEAREAKIEGTISLEGVVTTEGKLQDIKITKGLGYGLDKTVIETLTEHWHFETGTYKGEPVDVKVNFEINFRLAG